MGPPAVVRFPAGAEEESLLGGAWKLGVTVEVWSIAYHVIQRSRPASARGRRQAWRVTLAKLWDQCTCRKVSRGIPRPSSSRQAKGKEEQGGAHEEAWEAGHHDQRARVRMPFPLLPMVAVLARGWDPMREDAIPAGENSTRAVGRLLACGSFGFDQVIAVGIEHLLHVSCCPCCIVHLKEIASEFHMETIVEGEGGRGEN
jgi:hypothetical protein